MRELRRDRRPLSFAIPFRRTLCSGNVRCRLSKSTANHTSLTS